MDLELKLIGGVELDEGCNKFMMEVRELFVRVRATGGRHPNTGL